MCVASADVNHTGMLINWNGTGRGLEAEVQLAKQGTSDNFSF